MSKAQHTPGPWRYEPGQHDDSFAVKAPSSNVWQVCETYGYPTPGQSEANARLIAAAPDLLAACQRTKEILDAWGPERRGDTLERLSERINAAISKAQESP